MSLLFSSFCLSEWSILKWEHGFWNDVKLVYANLFICYAKNKKIKKKSKDANERKKDEKWSKNTTEKISSF